MAVSDTPEVSRALAPALVRATHAARWGERLAMLGALAAYAGLSTFGGLVLPYLTLSSRAPRVAGHALAATHVHDAATVAAFAVLLTVPAALMAEALAVGWRESSLRRMISGASSSLKTDLAFLALSHVQFTDFAGKVTMLAASMVTGLWVRGWIARRLGVEVDLGGLILPAQVAAYFAVFTFLDYWAHRLYHCWLFWPLHRYHHAATEFSVINAERAHPAAPLGTFLINLPMAVLGASPLVLIYVNALTHGLSLLIHSRIDSEWGWFGRWVLQSPNHHRLHHKLDMSRPTGNFSLAPIWDRLFGTWDGGAGDLSLVIGVATPYRHGLWIWPDVWRDFRDFCRGLVRLRPS